MEHGIQRGETDEQSERRRRMIDFNNYDDDFFESGEFDSQIEEFKEELRKSVKKEIQDKIEKLLKENEELQDIKKNFESIQRNFESKKSEYDRAMRDAEIKAKQTRLKELMDTYKIVLWSVDWMYQYKEKCDKCGTDRKIQITLPDGSFASYRCECGVGKKVYRPKEYVLHKMNDRFGTVNAWYRMRGKEGEEYIEEYDFSRYAKTIVNHDKSFKEINVESLSKVFFATKEECQEFCDYLNKIEESVGYGYDLYGELKK